MEQRETPWFGVFIANTKQEFIIASSQFQEIGLSRLLIKLWGLLFRQNGLFCVCEFRKTSDLICTSHTQCTTLAHKCGWNKVKIVTVI